MSTYGSLLGFSVCEYPQVLCEYLCYFWNHTFELCNSSNAREAFEKGRKGKGGLGHFLRKGPELSFKSGRKQGINILLSLNFLPGVDQTGEGFRSGDE